MDSSPYQAPSSELNHPGNFKRSVGWKVYFFVITVVSAAGMTSMVIDPAAGISEYTSLVIWVISTVGLFGFVFMKPIFNPRFWFVVLVIDLLFNVAYNFITNLDLRVGMTNVEFYVVTAIGWLLVLPIYYALFAYSRPSEPSWLKS